MWWKSRIEVEELESQYVELGKFCSLIFNLS